MLRILFCLAPVAILLSASAYGADGDLRERGPRDPEKRKQIIEKFDEDGDGRLSAEERKAAREEFMKNRGDRPEARRRGPREGGPEGRQRGPREGGPEGDRGARRGPPEGRRGPGEAGPRGDRPRGDGPPPRGPEGRGGPPNPAEMFDRADADGDGMLSKDEFMRLTRRMQQMRGPGGPQGPPRGEFGRGGRPGGERRGPGGPEGRGSENRGPRRGPPEE